MKKETKSHRILIVDDDKSNIRVLTEFLRHEYRIMAAKTGRQALKAAAGSHPPDLILLDIIMPEMDGYDTCRRLKQAPETRGIPVIFVTAVSEVMDEARAFELGAVDYVTKPFHPVTVKARVRTHIRLSATMRELASALGRVKRLSGLLPICATCKKIRDDKGYWNQVESYLQENTDARFSHGMCPDCSESLYGDKAWYREMKKDGNSDGSPEETGE